MKYKEEVFIKILTNRQLRLKVALALDMSENGVAASAKRRSSTLTKYPAPDRIKKELSLQDVDIFEPFSGVSA